MTAAFIAWPNSTGRCAACAACRATGICQLAGNADQVAVGSDLDGGFGSNQTPRELTSIADLGRLAPILADRGYTGDQVTAVLADNALRFLTTHLPIEAANDPGDAASTATSQRS